MNSKTVAGITAVGLTLIGLACILHFKKPHTQPKPPGESQPEPDNVINLDDVRAERMAQKSRADLFEQRYGNTRFGRNKNGSQQI